MPKGPKCIQTLWNHQKKKRLFCRKSAILSIKWKFQFWCPGGAPKNNPFGAIFIEFGATKKCCTFPGFELVPKSRKKLIGALSCMRKGPKCIQTLWDHQKKNSFLLKITKNVQYVRSLGKKPPFWGIRRG